MASIKIITRHAVNNYGSLLQSFATCKALEELCPEDSVEIIDYRRKDETGMAATIADASRKSKWNKGLRKAVYVLMRFPMEKITDWKFEKMRKRLLKTTPTVNGQKLKEIKGDIFITGSDQVWGPVGTVDYDRAYFLEFVGHDCKKIALAASFGKSGIKESDKTDIRNLLSEYDTITVREKKAIDIIAQMGINGCRQVLDPTLLLTPSQWDEFADTRNVPEGKYVLIYQLHKNEEMDTYAKRLAKTLNMPLIRVSPSLHQMSRGGKFVGLPSPERFLGYIKNSSVMVTDSFHGTVFAIIFKRLFAECLPSNKTEGRNIGLLQSTGLQNRILHDYNDFTMPTENIDYEKVDDLLNMERIESRSIIKDCLMS